MEAKNLGDIFFPLVAQELTAKRKGERNYSAKQVVRLGRDGGSKAVGRSRSAPMPTRRFPPPWSVKERKHHKSKAVGHAKTGGFAFVLDEYRLGGRYSPEVEPGRCSPGPTNKEYAHRTRPQARLCKWNSICPLAASRRLGLSRNWTPASSCATTTASSLRMSILRKSRGGARRPS
jgi:hypothetical protein